jgi:hypothetical protein
MEARPLRQPTAEIQGGDLDLAHEHCFLPVREPLHQPRRALHLKRPLQRIGTLLRRSSMDRHPTEWIHGDTSICRQGWGFRG